ncbi:MAG TPA: glycosyltransferase 87 family protein [Gaiellaceae bacterium]|nr:glycosyltransferase 87 family protein [Gaiellaceae bacterium]
MLAVAWAVLHVAPWTDYQIVDTPVYQRYGEAMTAGQVPYRDFRPEYPPAALPAFLLPALGPSDDYRTLFEILMLACGMGIVALVAATLVRVGVAGRELYAYVALAALAPLALGSVVLTRFDLWPALLTVAALAALVSGRDRLGLGVLGLATAAKLYPAVLLPVALVYAARRDRQNVLAALVSFVGALLLCFLPFLLLAPEGVWASIERQTGRPLQIESLGAALLLAGKQLGLYEPTVVSTFGSQNVSGSLPDRLASLQTLLQIVAVVAVWVAVARARDPIAGLLCGSAAAVVAFVAFGKVLSPQFLIWLVPLVPLAAAVSGLGITVLFVTALVLTQLWFPTRYWDVVDLGAVGWLVLVRDLVLVGLLVALVRSTLTGRARAPARSS